MRCHTISAINVQLVILVLVCVLFTVEADDSAASPPPLDMAALASLASNLGSNPQIMSLMSNFLNPVSQKAGLGTGSSGLQSDLGPGSDMDSNAMGQESNLNTANEPLRRGTKPMELQAPPVAAAVQAGPPSTTSSTSAAPPAASPLGGLMSMLPGVLSGLSQGGSGGGGGGGGANLGALTGLLGGLNNKPATATAPASEQPQATSSAATSTTTTATTATATATTPAASTNPAQSVINQVLSAYAAGQIPNELIQLSLSGRVPPQIIELALSGQVPPQIIQMVITGQVPMSTINSFLSATSNSAGSRASIGAESTVKSGNANNSQNNNNNNTSMPGVFSTTRAIFETLFGMVKRAGQQQLQQAVGGGAPGDGRPGVTVPTLVGPVALRMPNVRSLGQLIGGSITNFSSMIPF